MKKTLEVRTAKKIASEIFLQLVLMYFFLSIARLILTWMNNAPKHPHTPPIKIAAGMSSNVFSSGSRVPNFRVAASVNENGDPFLSAVKIESMKVQIDDPKKTLHNMLNVQYVFGFDIS